MARSRRTEDHVLGPYEHHGGWRYVLVGADGVRENSCTFASQTEAAEDARNALNALALTKSLTVEDALSEYETWLVARRQQKPGPIATALFRLRAFLPPTEIVSLITADRAQQIYDRYCTTPRKLERARRALLRSLGRAPKPSELAAHLGGDLATLGEDMTKWPEALVGELPADTTQLNTLSRVRTFWQTYCVPKKLAKFDPWADVETRGVLTHGKDQLRIDEARRWEDAALEAIEKEGCHGAIGALMAFWMALRESEIVTRQCRDVDDNGTLLWIAETRRGRKREIAWTPKTRPGYRAIPVPPQMQPMLLALRGNRDELETLLPARSGGPHNRKWVLDWVQLICRRAGVTEVTAHGMRGLHKTLDDLGTRTAREAEARYLGHSDTAIGDRAYGDRIARAISGQRSVMKILAGGRK